MRASPEVAGVPTEGPPVGLKSDVTFNVILPAPPTFVVRILYVNDVLPVNGFAKMPGAAARFVVPVSIDSAASAATLS